MILGYVTPVKLETFQLNNVKTVIRLKELKNKLMRLFLLPLICQTVSVKLSCFFFVLNIKILVIYGVNIFYNTKK